MRRVPRVQDERGIALVLALFALVVMSALVAGSFVAGRLEQQSGRNTLFAHQAAEAAEAGLADALVTISSGRAMPARGGAPMDLDSLNFGAGFMVERQVSRLTSTVLLVRSAAARLDAGGETLAVRAVGTLLRLAADSQGGPPRATPLDQRDWTQLP
jgi:hypothetical protein